jgi:glycosyltransferase involved in cell wall biosynthesis
MTILRRDSASSPVRVIQTFTGDVHSRSTHDPAFAEPDATTSGDARDLRLALFTDTWAPHVNGVSRTLERLRAAVDSRGGTTHVFTVDDPALAADGPSTEGVTRARSVPFWAYPQLQLAWPSGRDVARELLAFRPTLVHVATEFGVGLAGRRVARSLGIPLVTSYHTSFAAYAQYYRLGLLARPGWQYLRWFHGAAARTYCPTEAIKAEIEAQGFRRVSVWSRGVDATRFSPRYRSPALRQQMGVDDDTLVVAYVGRLAPEKGLGAALTALQSVARARPGKVAFMFVGDGPFEGEVHRGTPEPRWLPGKLLGDDLSRAYASADVFLFPSTTDTFGNVLLEAMASGLPVIGADVGPTREVLGETRGLLVLPDNAEALAAAIIRCVDDRAMLRRLAGAARAFAESCTWDRIWSRLFADYRKLQSAPRAAFVDVPQPAPANERSRRRRPWSP